MFSWKMDQPSLRPPHAVQLISHIPRKEMTVIWRIGGALCKGQLLRPAEYIRERQMPIFKLY